MAAGCHREAPAGHPAPVCLPGAAASAEPGCLRRARLQKPVDGGLSIVRYELSPQETPEGRSKLADGFVACTCRDREALTALQALSDALCGDNQAPLKRRLLEGRLARDVRPIFKRPSRNM